MPRPVEARPLKQHQIKTTFLRVPSPVWPLISTGKVREFRAGVGNVPQAWRVLPMPTLALAYRKRLSTPEYDYRLLMVEGARREALGTISDAGLAAAGYEGEDAFRRFRRDWMITEKRRFEPLRRVIVFTVRPIREGDLEEVGLALVEHLYGTYLAQAQDRPATISADRRRGVMAGSR